jgi:predicted nucleic acid-binding protein
MVSGAPRSAHALLVLVDTNVILDLLLNREPWWTLSAPFWHAHDTDQIVTYMAASVTTDIFYICRKIVGLDRATIAIETCLRGFEIVSVDRDVLMKATKLSGADFEDNVQIACAMSAHLDVIVTRDPAGFAHSSIPAIEPQRISSYLRSAAP